MPDMFTACGNSRDDKPLKAETLDVTIKAVYHAPLELQLLRSSTIAAATQGSQIGLLVRHNVAAGFDEACTTHRQQLPVVIAFSTKHRSGNTLD